MDRLEVAWSELFGDEDVDVGFDPSRRDEPPWFGFIPRVLGVDLTRPFHPTLALWSRGRVVEVATFTVDRREFPGTARALLMLAESFADMSRERNLFGAHLATFDLWRDAACAAATAAIIREADWCGMFVLEPAEYVGRGGVGTGGVVGGGRGEPARGGYDTTSRAGSAPAGRGLGSEKVIPLPGKRPGSRRPAARGV
jgi:hypothetical protein